MFVKLISHTSEDAMLEAAQVCRNSDNPRKALEHALKAGHDSLMEHWVASFRVNGISRTLSHQLVRSRIASYAQQSQRHVKINTDCDEFVVPDTATKSYQKFAKQAFENYQILIEEGMPLEDARFILPNATFTDIVITMNARSLDTFFKSRICSHAQWEIRNMAVQMFLLCDACCSVFKNKSYPDCKFCKERCEKPFKI